MRQIFYSFIVLLFTSFNVYAQQLKSTLVSKPIQDLKSIHNGFCGLDHFHKEKMKNDADYRLRHLQTIENIKQAQILQAKSTEEIYQVPVVVHIMHKGEAIGEGTNISDADVRTGIQYLNNFWRKISGTNGDGNGVDMEVEFALAVQDENGNCTNGIVRKDMSGVPAYVDNGVNRQTFDGIPDYDSDQEVNSLKEYSIWDPNRYYNVWLVDKIDNANCYSGGSYTSGYAFYASSHGQAYNGTVVLICSYIDESSDTWAHEMGHALNLPHTFDGDDDSDDGIYTCGDDGIDDTPKHIRSSSSELNIYWDCDNSDVNSCDPNFNEQMSPTHIGNGTHQDHMRNYMDYTGCSSEFTYGQRDVAKAALTNERASYLPEYGNTALVPPTIATVDFSSSISLACSGLKVKFTDQSTCTPNTYTNEPIDGITFNWTFDNGLNTPFTSIDQNPVITFDNAGTYDVTLEITNVHGTNSLTKSGLVTVSDLDLITVNMFDSSGDGGGEVTVGGVTATNAGASSATIVCVDLSACNAVDYEATDGWAYENSWSVTDASGEVLAEGLDSDGEFGACTSDELGCTDSLACNYDASATDAEDCTYADDSCEICDNGAVLLQDADGDGVCDTDEVVGCTDTTACNYNASATNEGACTYADANACETCVDGAPVVTDDSDGDGVCNANEVEGCTDEGACNYNENATDSNDSCEYAEDYYDCDGSCLNDTDGDGVCNEIELEGCIYLAACNYNSAATDDINSCVFPTGCETCSGETDGTGTTVDNDEDDDGVCDADEVVGCQVETACNFMALATDPGDCTFATGCDTCSGETDGTGALVDNDADDDGVCDENEIVGCTDEGACNYNENATDSNDSCEYAEDYYDCDGSCLNDTDGDGVCDEIEVLACTDPEACNYDATPTMDTDNTLCTYATDGTCDTCSGETDGTGTVLDNDADADGVCDGDEVEGCTDTEACNYNENATDSNDSCEYAEDYYDCDGSCLNDTDGDGVCDEIEVLACTDPEACNYDATPTRDTDNTFCTYATDGTCVTCSGETDGTGTVLFNDADADGVCDGDEVVGCQDETACNYNENATDAGDCTYSIDIDACVTCSGATDGTGIVIEAEADNLNLIIIEVGGGSFLFESTWELEEYTGGSGSTEVCLEDGCHIFNMYDQFGDGWNGSNVTITTENGDILLFGTLDSGFEGVLEFGLNEENCSELGVVDIEDSGIKLYPNPATDRLYLEANNTFSELNIEVVNVIGEVVLEPKLTNIQSGDIIEFNIEDLSTGLYYLKVSSNQELITMPWMKR